jgi:hypothetical protein
MESPAFTCARYTASIPIDLPTNVDHLISSHISASSDVSDFSLRKIRRIELAKLVQTMQE